MDHRPVQTPRRAPGQSPGPKERTPKNASRLGQEITERTEKIDGEAFTAIDQKQDRFTWRVSDIPIVSPSFSLCFLRFLLFNCRIQAHSSAAAFFPRRFSLAALAVVFTWPG